MNNKYELVIFDGVNCRTLLVLALDMQQAINNSGYSQQVISAKLICSDELEDFTQQ